MTVPAHYLLLTMPHKTEMGPRCNDIYLYDTNANQSFQGGEVPYALSACNATTVQLIISNKTLMGLADYSSFYIYYSQPWLQSYASFSNISVSQSFEQKFVGSGHAYAADYTLTPNPYFIKFNSFMEINESIFVASQAMAIRQESTDYQTACLRQEPRSCLLLTLLLTILCSLGMAKETEYSQNRWRLKHGYFALVISVLIL